MEEDMVSVSELSMRPLHRWQSTQEMDLLNVDGVAGESSVVKDFFMTNEVSILGGISGFCSLAASSSLVVSSVVARESRRLALFVLRGMFGREVCKYCLGFRYSKSCSVFYLFIDAAALVAFWMFPVFASVSQTTIGYLFISTIHRNGSFVIGPSTGFHYLPLQWFMFPQM